MGSQASRVAGLVVFDVMWGCRVPSLGLLGLDAGLVGELWLLLGERGLLDLSSWGPCKGVDRHAVLVGIKMTAHRGVSLLSRGTGLGG